MVIPAVLFAAAIAAHGDVIILRSGDVKRGAIKSCGGDSCVMGSTVYTRENMAWIGLGSANAQPPAVVDASEDEVHLRDRSTHRGHLIGVSLGEVDIDNGTYDRDEVEWIHLAGAPEAPQPKTPITATSPPQPPMQPPPQPPSHTTTQPPAPQPQPPSSKQPPPAKPAGERGHLWSGQILIHLRQTHDSDFTDVKTDIAAHLREYRSPLLRPPAGDRYGTFVRLISEGSQIHTTFESDVSSSVGDSHCQGSGTTDASERPGASTIWISNTDADTTPWIGFPIVRKTPRYQLGLQPATANHFDANCHSWTIDAAGRHEYDGTQEEPFYVSTAGKPPITGCPGYLQHVCDPEIRTIAGESGRMFGSYHNAWDDNGFRNDLTVRWSLCRDDVPCTNAPPEPEKNPCGSTAAQDALLQTCEDQQKQLIDALVAKYSQYQHTKAEAAPYESDFRKAMLACAAWDTAQTALEFLVLGDIPEIGASEHIAEEAHEVKEALETINALMKAAMTGNPLQALNTGQVAELTTAMETVNEFIEKYHLLQEDTPESFLETLEKCNAPLSESMQKNAEQYLLDTRRALEELEEFHKIGNDERSKSNECLQKQWDAYVACVQNARCNNTPESACDSKKPPGNWPPVP